MARFVVAEAPAKVNLYLGVGARRADGYHDVTTVLQALDLCDTVRVRPGRRLHVSCTPGVGLPAEENLAFRAAARLAERFSRVPDVAIEIDKVVPAGAGLGGGSSDAAAVLEALVELWGLGRESEEVRAAVLEVAAGLGADVPFFLSGGGALYSGRGDVLVRAIPALRLHLVLVKPDAPVGTAQAYAAFDADPQPAADPAALVAACESGDRSKIARLLANNLETAACRLVSEVADALAWLRQADGILGAAVSGSGSAVFGISEDESTAREVAMRAAELGWWSAATASRDAGVRVSWDEEAS